MERVNHESKRDRDSKGHEVDIKSCTNLHATDLASNKTKGEEDGKGVVGAFVRAGKELGVVVAVVWRVDRVGAK